MFKQILKYTSESIQNKLDYLEKVGVLNKKNIDTYLNLNSFKNYIDKIIEEEEKREKEEREKEEEKEK